MIFTLTLIVVMSVFVGALLPGEDVEFNVGGDIGSPGIWDVITFVGGAFWGILTFSIGGLPWIFNLFFWMLTLINMWCIVRLIRGVS